MSKKQDQEMPVGEELQRKIVLFKTLWNQSSRYSPEQMKAKALELARKFTVGERKAVLDLAVQHGEKLEERSNNAKKPENLAKAREVLKQLTDEQQATIKDSITKHGENSPLSMLSVATVLSEGSKGDDNPPPLLVPKNNKMVVLLELIESNRKSMLSAGKVVQERPKEIQMAIEKALSGESTQLEFKMLMFAIKDEVHAQLRSTIPSARVLEDKQEEGALSNAQLSVVPSAAAPSGSETEEALLSGESIEYHA